MVLLKQPTGIDWKKARFIIGTRADLAADPLPQPAYARICEECGSTTYTETEYPLDVPVVCTVCTARMTAPLEDDPHTQLLFDMPND